MGEEIIKHAVHWFTGDASVDGFGGDDGEEDDEDGEFGGEGDEDDEDDEEDGDFAPPEGGEGKPGASSSKKQKQPLWQPLHTSLLSFSPSLFSFVYQTG